MNGDRDGNYDLLRLFQQCDESVETEDDALLEVASIVHATIKPRVAEEALKMGELCKHRLQLGKAMLLARLWDDPPRHLLTTTMISLYDERQWIDNFGSTSQSHAAPVYYISLTTRA